MDLSDFLDEVEDIQKQVEHVERVNRFVIRITDKVKSYDEVEWKASVGLLADAFYTNDYEKKLEEYTMDLMKNADIPEKLAPFNALKYSINEEVEELVKSIPIEYFMNSEGSIVNNYNRFHVRF